MVLMMVTATVNHHIGDDYMMVDSCLISDGEDSVGGRLGRQSLGHSVHGEVQAKMTLILTVCIQNFHLGGKFLRHHNC